MSENEVAQDIQFDKDNEESLGDRPPHPDFLHAFKIAQTSFFVDLYRIIIIVIYSGLWLLLHPYFEKKVIAVIILAVELVTGWIIDDESSWLNRNIDGKMMKNGLTFMTIFALITFQDGQRGWYSFLSSAILLIIIFFEIVRFSKFPNESTDFKLFQMIPVLIQYLRWLFFSESLDQTHLTIVEFIFVNQLLGFLPALIRAIKDPFPFSKSEFLYSQMYNSQIMRYCFLPFYQSISPIFVLIMLIQNAVYFVIMKKMDSEIIAAKMGRDYDRNSIIRITQNAFIVTTSKVRKTIIVPLSSKKDKFTDQMCSNCLRKKSSFFSSGCEHVTLCLRCVKHLRGDFNCSICMKRSNRGYYIIRSNRPQMNFLKAHGINTDKYCLYRQYWAVPKNAIHLLLEEEEHQDI